ncbi:MAG: hypothetical protein BAJALOKI1v1_1040008 [Promethearchaeota archaeon]|nr:MAG: hypothetical protein BAJALOKI1v1_1040008 [Candidatus Lokiarchaeota archaeon]
MAILNFEELSAQEQSLLRILANIDENKLKDLCGKRNYDLAKKSGPIDCEVNQFKGSMLSLKLKQLSQTYQIELNILGDLRRSQCSCSHISLYSKRKRCIHLALALIHIMEHPEDLLENLKQDDTKPAFSKEEIKRLQKEAEEQRKKIESLKLDPIIIENTLIEINKAIISLTLQGLQRLSHSTLEWLNDLIIKTQIAKLANINKELKKLVELIKQYLDKSVLFDMGEYKYRMNQLTNFYLLAKRLIRGETIVYPGITPDIIIGKFRSSYIPHEDVHAQCIGMSGWLSRDDQFVGCTGYYLNLKSNKLFSISNVLPTMYFGRNPKKLYNQPLKTINLAMSQLAHGAFTFLNVKFNDKGNLSLHNELKIFPSPSKDIFRGEQFKEFKIHDWIVLIDKICTFEATPIRLPYSLANYFILEPKHWGKFEFDAIQQEYKAYLIDQENNVALLRVQNVPHNKLIIENLQSIYKNESMMPNALLGSIYVKDGYLTINPVTLLWYQGIKLRESTSIYRSEKDFVSEFHLNLENARNLSFV